LFLCAARPVDSLIAGPVPARQDAILIIHSYHHGFSWTDSEGQGIREALAEGRGDRVADIQEFWLDNRHLGPDSAVLAASLDRLYRQRPLDLIFVTDNLAFDLVRGLAWVDQRRIPVVFCGVNNFDPAHIKDHPSWTGVAENFISGRRDTLNAARRLQADTRRFVFLLDASPTSAAIRAEIVRMKADFPEVDFRFEQEENLDRQLALVSRLKPGDIFIPVGIHRDATGNLVGYETAMEALSAACPVPAYGFIENRMGHGLVGGKLLPGRDHGRTAGELGVRILAGAAPASIPPILDNPGRFVFDWRQLSRFGLDPARLPGAATILNRPADTWKLVRDYLPFALTVFALQVVIIILLLANRRRLRLANQANADKAALADQLARANSRLETQVAERTAALSQTLADLQASQQHISQSNRLNLLNYTVTGMVKEIAAPLGSILMSGSYLQSQLRELGAWGLQNLSAGQQAAFAAMHQRLEASSELFVGNASRLGRTIEQFKQLSADQSRDLKREFYLADVVNSTCQLLRGSLLAAHPGISLSSDIPIGIRMGSHPGSLSVCLVQLVTNCVEHAFARSHRGRITIRGRLAGSMVELVVSDDGQGMSEEQRQQVFTPFFTTRRPSGSVGLGLSIVEMNVIDRLKGRISCQSAPGEGTTLRLELPQDLP
jgi:signal transduction histidine kinase